MIGFIQFVKNIVLRVLITHQGLNRFIQFLFLLIREQKSIKHLHPNGLFLIETLNNINIFKAN